MPDGSDCCATCWFNAKNNGEAKPHAVLAQSSSPEPDACVIRALPLHDPIHTYCANHPERNPARIEVPVGPVFTGEGRELWRRSPENDEVRATLLEMLSEISDQPAPMGPPGISLEETVIWQLGELREQRARPDLSRIASFPPGTGSEDPNARSRDPLISEARMALEKIQRKRPIEFTENRPLEGLEDLRKSTDAYVATHAPAEEPSAAGGGGKWIWLLFGPLRSLINFSLNLRLYRFELLFINDFLLE